MFARIFYQTEKTYHWSISFKKTNSILGGNILLEVNRNCTGRWGQGFQLAIKPNWNYCKPHSRDIIKYGWVSEQLCFTSHIDKMFIRCYAEWLHSKLRSSVEVEVVCINNHKRALVSVSYLFIVRLKGKTRLFHFINDISEQKIMMWPRRRRNRLKKKRIYVQLNKNIISLWIQTPSVIVMTIFSDTKQQRS